MIEFCLASQSCTIDFIWTCGFGSSSVAFTKRRLFTGAVEGFPFSHKNSAVLLVNEDPVLLALVGGLDAKQRALLSSLSVAVIQTSARGKLENVIVFGNTVLRSYAILTKVKDSDVFCII